MRTTAASLLVLSVLFTGCKGKTPPNTTADVVTPAAPSQRSVAPEMVHLRLVDNFKRVNFETDSAILDTDSKKIITDNADIMRDHPFVEIIVIGHADERGTDAYNRELGEERAHAVRDAMVAEGIDADRIHIASHGENHDLVDTDSLRAWSLDRRAEFVVLSDPFDQVDGTIDNRDRGPERDYELRVE